MREIDAENTIIQDDGKYEQIVKSMPKCFEIKQLQEKQKKLDIVNIAISSKGAEKAKPILEES